ncbi:MAG: glycerophosphodiester phosphodiesterase family protein [Bacilli bacterium]|nr:glycerophosphodiester phosphodiesterase family protein [Bacilli bacterium]
MHKLYSHRGNVGSQNHDDNQMDNSIEAVKVSITRPYIDGFELDFRLTKDKQLITTHDRNIKHISQDKRDKEISEMTLEELQAEKMHDIYYYYKGLIARARFLPDSKRLISIMESKLDSNAKIPTADDILKYIVETNPNKDLLLELKENTQACADSLSSLINKYKDTINISAHGYDEKLMLSIKEQTGVKTGILVKHDQTGPLSKIKGQPDRLSTDYIKNMPFDFWSVMWCWLKTHQVVAMMNNNKGFNFWTIDSLMHLNYIFNTISNVEKVYGSVKEDYGVITNIPDLINEYTDKGRNQRR